MDRINPMLLFMGLMVSMTMLSLVSAQFAFRTESDGIEACETPDGLDGECINLRDCGSLLKLLRRPVPPAVISHLRKSVCGFEEALPDVCCPKPQAEISPQKTAVDTTTAEATEETTTTVEVEEVRLPSVSECGYSESEHQRIVGGSPSELNAWPWIAALGFRKDNETKYLCGGSLITTRHVLTAAHCAIRNDLYTVRLGEHNLAREDDGANPIEIDVAEKIIHSKYHSRTYDNDIALLTLSQDVTFTKEVAPVCLPNKLDFLSGRLYIDHTPHIAGWGTTQFRGSTSDELLEIQLKVLSNEACNDVFSKFNIHVANTKLCALDPLGIKDACQGDSGGPMMISFGYAGDGSGLENSTWFQIGVVSFGYQCAVPGFPGVYTRVSEFTEWIEDNLSEPFKDAFAVRP